MKCKRCGRTTHWTQGCYAKKDINGNDITSKAPAQAPQSGKSNQSNYNF